MSTHQQPYASPGRPASCFSRPAKRRQFSRPRRASTPLSFRRYAAPARWSSTGLTFFRTIRAASSSRFAARAMVPREQGLIANISSSGAAEYAWHVAYGVGKAALDRITADTAHELRDHGVTVVSLWPGLVMTERIQRVGEAMPALDTSRAESLRFTGRAIVALAVDSHVHAKTGRVLASRDLADEYGFTDVDGKLPAGPVHDRPAGVPDSQP